MKKVEPLLRLKLFFFSLWTKSPATKFKFPIDVAL